jgi:hypothetical protein
MESGEMAKTRENQVEDPNEEVVSLVHDIATGERREVRVKRVEVWRSLLGLDDKVSAAQVQAAWQARKADSEAEDDRQNRRKDDMRSAAARLRDFDVAGLTSSIRGVEDEPTRQALTGLAALLFDLRTVIQADQQ